MEIRWHGHSFFSLVCADGTSILLDPYFGLTRRRIEDFDPDLVLLTHGHADHVGSALDLLRPQTRLVATFELGNLMERRGAARVVHMNLGGTYRHGRVTLWMAPALHSSGFHAGEQEIYAGNPCGFVVDDGSTRFYHAGDTGLFGDMRTVIRDLLQPHVAAVPIGDLYTMGAAHAARAVEWLGVNVAVPMHYDTFEPIRADPAVFAKAVGPHAQVVVPPVDGGFAMEGSRLGRRLEP